MILCEMPNKDMYFKYSIIKVLMQNKVNICGIGVVEEGKNSPHDSHKNLTRFFGEIS